MSTVYRCRRCLSEVEFTHPVLNTFRHLSSFSVRDPCWGDGTFSRAEDMFVSLWPGSPREGWCFVVAAPSLVYCASV
jgi:hypothetical protein